MPSCMHGFCFLLVYSIYTVQFLVATICQFSFRAETCYYEWASTEWAGAWLTTAATAAGAAAAAAAGNNTVIWGSCIFSLSPQFFPQGILFYLPLPKSRPPLKKKMFKNRLKRIVGASFKSDIQYLFPLYFNIFIEKIRIRNILCHNLPRLKLYLGGLGDLGLGGSALRLAGELNSDLWCGLFPCSSLSLTAKMMGKP